MCDIELESRDDYYMHVYSHIQSDNGLECTRCGHVYTTEDELRNHLPTHVPAILAQVGVTERKREQCRCG